MKIALVVALLSAALSAADAPKLSLRVNKTVAFYPEPVELSVSVWPNEESRFIDVSYELASTLWTIERVPGAEIRQEKRNFKWRITEPGEYVIVLSVLDAAHKIQAQKTVTIQRIAPQ